MKKILLATTVLAASAGYAAADITWAGSAEMGIADWDGSGWESYSGAALDITMSGSSDSGLTFGATFSIGAGTHFDGLDDGIGEDDGTLGAPEVYVEGSFGRLSMNHNGYGFFHNDDSDDDQGDLKYTGTFGALSVGIISDVEGTGFTAANNSVNLGYTMNSLTLTLNADDDDSWDASVSYAMGQVTVGLSTGDDSVNTVNVDYDNGAGMTAGLEVSDDDSWSVSGGYSANALSINAEIDSDNAWEVTGSYDLGGGLSLEGGVDDENDMFIGAAMTF